MKKIFKTALALQLLICGASSQQLFAADDDRASRDNADSARDAHENGSGRGVDCDSYDWGSRDKDDNHPGNDNENRGTIPSSQDSKD